MWKPFFTAIPFVLLLSCGGEPLAPTAQHDRPTLQVRRGPVVHRVSVGGPDFCAAFGLRPGCNQNFSLIAMQYADGSVSGELHDGFGVIAGFGGIGIHADVTCLHVVGNQAWVGAIVTQSRLPFLVGVEATITVVDNGTTANDPPDQTSEYIVGSSACQTAPVVPLHIVPEGQITVQ